MASSKHLVAGALIWTAAAAAPPTETTDATFQRLCSQCHGADRLGGVGPALIPETLGRLEPEEAIHAILEGRPASQMPAFGGQIDEETAARLAEYVFNPPAEKAEDRASSPPGSVATGEGPARPGVDRAESWPSPRPLPEAESPKPGNKDGKGLVPEIRGYEILYSLGQGGMGVVYLAKRAENGARVALKVIRPSVVVSERDVGSMAFSRDRSPIR